MNKVLIIFAAIVMAFATTGCNTFEGMGRDIESAGESIQKM